MWEYTNHPNHHRALSTAAKALLDGLRAKQLDIRQVFKDSRWCHERMFRSLVPKGVLKCLAGGYRGEGNGPLKKYEVRIPSNRLVGIPAARVLDAMRQFGADADSSISQLDLLHQDASTTEVSKLIATVEVACRLICEFLLIHPYANGNGHIARLMLIGLLLRYGYEVGNFDLHPAPFTPGYNAAIAAYQKALKGVVGGDQTPLHRYVLNCLKNQPSP